MTSTDLNIAAKSSTPVRSWNVDYRGSSYPLATAIERYHNDYMARGHMSDYLSESEYTPLVDTRHDKLTLLVASVIFPLALAGVIFGVIKSDDLGWVDGIAAIVGSAVGIYFVGGTLVFPVTAMILEDFLPASFLLSKEEIADTASFGAAGPALANEVANYLESVYGVTVTSSVARHIADRSYSNAFYAEIDGLNRKLKYTIQNGSLLILDHETENELPHRVR